VVGVPVVVDVVDVADVVEVVGVVESPGGATAGTSSAADGGTV
jgi:hypothetical protein